MARTVSWTTAGWNDLEEVAQYIARGSPFYAATVVREALAAARSLADWPERGWQVADFDDPAIREILVRKYRLIYLVAPSGIHVLGFIHGARDLPALWKREGRIPPDQD